MSKPDINATEVIKFSLYLVVLAVGVVLWFPTVAQDKVDLQHGATGPATEAHKRIEAKADENDKRLDEIKNELTKTQTELKNTQQKLDELGPKLDKLSDALNRGNP